jgi:hypothetical protein
MMDYDVLEARYLRDHVVWVRCRDGSSGEADLSGVLRGPVFEPLHDVEYFRRFEIDPIFRTFTWPNGADVAPEFLHDSVKVKARPSSTAGGG